MRRIVILLGLLVWTGCFLGGNEPIQPKETTPTKTAAYDYPAFAWYIVTASEGIDVSSDPRPSGPVQYGQWSQGTVLPLIDEYVTDNLLTAGKVEEIMPPPWGKVRLGMVHYTIGRPGLSLCIEGGAIELPEGGQIALPSIPKPGYEALVSAGYLVPVERGAVGEPVELPDVGQISGGPGQGDGF